MLALSQSYAPQRTRRSEAWGQEAGSRPRSAPRASPRPCLCPSWFPPGKRGGAWGGSERREGVTHTGLHRKGAGTSDVNVHQLRTLAHQGLAPSDEISAESGCGWGMRPGASTPGSWSAGAQGARMHVQWCPCLASGHLSPRGPGTEPVIDLIYRNFKNRQNEFWWYKSK